MPVVVGDLGTGGFRERNSMQPGSVLAMLVHGGRKAERQHTVYDLGLSADAIGAAAHHHHPVKDRYLTCRGICPCHGMLLAPGAH